MVTLVLFALFMVVIVLALLVIWSDHQGSQTAFNPSESPFYHLRRDVEVVVPVEVMAAGMKLPRGYKPSGGRHAKGQMPYYPSLHRSIAKSINDTLHPVEQAPSMMSVRAVTGERFEVSRVAYETAQKAFKFLASQPLPHESDTDTCFARAHLMSHALERKGVFTGKAMATGEFHIASASMKKPAVRWGFHVAPALIVEERGRKEIWVLDPTLFNGPAPLEHWFAMLTLQPGSRLDNAYLAPRFSYHPLRDDKSNRSWRRDDMRSAEALVGNASARSN